MKSWLFTVVRNWRTLAFAGSMLLTACGGGGGSAGDPINGGGGSGGGGSTPTVTIEISLQDGTGNPITEIATGTPVRARATLRRSGVAVANEIVNFEAEQAVELVRFDPASGSLLTDANGVAQITVSSLGNVAGAGRVRAKATVSGIEASSATNFYALASSAQQPTTLTLSAVNVGSASVSAYGTTGVSVQVLQNNAPYTSPVNVSFTTSCPVTKATITESTVTQPNGTAVATFNDNGCAQNGDATVTITASISTDSKSASTVVKAPNTGSLRFVSVNPSDKSITLRGQGGNGRQENASVTFQLVDVAGNGVGNADVCFDATTFVGGLNVDGFEPLRLPNPQGSSALCGTDALSVVRYVKRTNADGTITVQINSGNIPTPVRLRARTIYPIGSATVLESFSDTLSISTGLPLQRSMSLSVDKANIDGGNFDGETAIFTVRLADQFSNPVPDGTVVNFIASGAAVCTADNGSCRTVNGACSCNLVSQERRPLDRRVIVTAYAVGLEDFDDRNGDNQYTVDSDPFYDLGDAYVDANKDGLPNSATINGDTDILVPYQVQNTFTPAGNGSRGTAHIRRSSVVYLSQSSSAGSPSVVIPLDQLERSRYFDGRAASSPFLRLDEGCPAGSSVPITSFSFTLEDGIGNPMAATTVLTAVDASDNLNVGGFRPNLVPAFGAAPPSPLIDLPNIPKPGMWTRADAFGTVPTGHGITIRGVSEKCGGSAGFALQVTSPKGGAALATIYYEGEPRNSVSRSRYAVNYSPEVRFDLTQPDKGKPVTLTPEYWVESAAGAPAATSYSIDWGDGTVESNLPISPAQRSHVYTKGEWTVTVTVTAGDFQYRATKSISVQ